MRFGGKSNMSDSERTKLGVNQTERMTNILKQMHSTRNFSLPAYSQQVSGSRSFGGKMSLCQSILEGPISSRVKSTHH